MNEEKKNRVVAAATVAAVLLVVIFAVVIICQVATIVNKNKEKISLQEQIRSYDELIKDSENELAYLKSWEYYEDMLSWYNYHPAKN